MLNKIFLMGRLVADPELRCTPTNTPVTTFRIAVDRDFKDRETGERKADFISVVAWRNTAEFVARNFRKGSLAVVVGQLQIRDWTDSNGNKRTSPEVIADNIYFGGGKRENSSSTPHENKFDAGGQNQQSFSYPTTSSNPGMEQIEELDSPDGDLPF